MGSPEEKAPTIEKERHSPLIEIAVEGTRKWLEKRRLRQIHNLNNRLPCGKYYAENESVEIKLAGNSSYIRLTQYVEERAPSGEWTTVARENITTITTEDSGEITEIHATGDRADAYQGLYVDYVRGDVSRRSGHLRGVVRNLRIAREVVQGKSE